MNKQTADKTCPKCGGRMSRTNSPDCCGNLQSAKICNDCCKVIPDTLVVEDERDHLNDGAREVLNNDIARENINRSE